MQEAAGYSNLEFDLASGERGDRYGHAGAALARLTGAEAALVVNNCASSVLLALSALSERLPARREGASLPVADAGATGRPEVLVSRGQLVEIGGGFRVPDVLRRSGADLVEVGTTNRTYLADFEGALQGELDGPVEIGEGGHRFLVDIAESQKTGFFLDQREMRRLAALFSRGRLVLNAFAYTGAFSVYALKGGALRVDAVDTSAPALELGRRNIGLNGLDESKARFEAADVFAFLRRKNLDYDFIILDPPAFAKKKSDVIPACRGYKDINRLAMLSLPPGGLLMTFSCSHFVDETLFRKVLFQAAREADRTVKILQKQRMALDHPVNIYHPESEYLKGFLLHVD